MRSDGRRNFQILPPLDFLAEFTQYIPPKGAHLIRYYGHYLSKSRGMRRGTRLWVAAAEQPEKAAKPSGGDDGFRCGTDPLHEDLGYAHQAGLRSGSVIESSLWLLPP